jgi:hypothetical protein
MNRLKEFFWIEKRLISIIKEFGTMNIPRTADPDPQVVEEELKKDNPKTRYSENIIVIIPINAWCWIPLIFKKHTIIIPTGIIRFIGKTLIWKG